VEQVLVPKDDLVFRKAIRNKISKDLNLSSYPFYKEDLVEIIEDFYLPSLVYFFQESPQNDFLEYISGINLRLGVYTDIYQRISNLIENLDYDYFKSLNVKDIKILGDVHPPYSTKVRIDDSIYYKDFPDYHELLVKLGGIINYDLSKYYPNIVSQKEGLFKREFISIDSNSSNVETIKDFYFNLGRIISLLITLRTIDINAENVLINLPYPVFFDMETIFSGDFNPDWPEYSIENTGLLKISKENDNSLLTAGILPRESLLKPIIINNSKRPEIKWRTKSRGKFSNIPQYHGKRVNPHEFKKNLLDGYENGFSEILEKKGLIKEMVKSSKVLSRVVLRPTRIYRLLALKSCYPQIYLKKDVKDFLTASLKEYPVIYDIDSLSLLDSEVESIFNLEVPVFYSSIFSKEILDPSRSVVASWKKTQYSCWSQFLENTLSSEFFLEQKSLIEEALN
jgi:lantibiotic modifying enzyme